MSIDDRGRRAANEMRNSRRDAKFTVRSPSQGGGPSLWPILGVAVVAIVALIGLTQLLGNAPEEAVDSTAVETTMPATTIPPTSRPPATTAPPTTTTTPTTTPPATTQPPVEIPDRALAFSGANLVWVDTASGDTEVIQESMFEAAYPSRLALRPDRSRAYYHLVSEDSWFSCETVAGEIVMVDLQSGETTTIGEGLPALSPDGSRLAYLTGGCAPDPQAPEGFIPVFDTLVVTDADGNEQTRFSLEGEPGTREKPPSTNLVWSDNGTVLVQDESGTTYEIQFDDGGLLVMSEVDLPQHELLAVVDGVGIGAVREAAASWGPLETVDLVSGAVAPVGGIPETGFEYHVGVSPDNAVIVGYTRDSDAGGLAIINPTTGEIIQTFNLPAAPGGVDW